MGRQNDDEEEDAGASLAKAHAHSSKIPNKILKAVPAFQSQPAHEESAFDFGQSLQASSVPPQGPSPDARAHHSASQFGLAPMSAVTQQLQSQGKPLSAYRQKKLQEAVLREQGITPTPGKRGRKRLNPLGVDALAASLQKEKSSQQASVQKAEMAALGLSAPGQ